MIVDRKGKSGVIVRRRDPDTLERIEETIRDISPFGFILEEDSLRIPLDCMSRENGYVGVYGERLTKITLPDPFEVSSLKDKFTKTWECNIPFTNRVLSERMVTQNKEPYPNYEHRICYLDMEWMWDSGKINVITIADSYSPDKLFTWILDPDKKMVHNKNYYPKPKTFDNERSLLMDFLRFFKSRDFDVITGWNVVNADLQQLIKRFQVNKMDPKKLSPIGIVRYDFGDWDQPIAGINTIDLMVSFCRLWEIKNGKLPNKKLDTVAWEVLQDRKTELEDGHDTYYTDRALYVEYNRQDVALLPRLDDTLNAIKHHLAIQHIAQCEIRTTPHITKIVTCLALNDPDWNLKIPSRPQFKKVDYEGADIMDPAPGVYRSIGILDVKAMYHSNAALHNISWETLDKDGEDCGNGTCFHRKHTGLLVRLMDKMTDLRNDYKKLMLSDPDNKSTWDAMQYATKSIVASMYGTAGDSKFGLYHPRVAAAITYTSRNTLKKLRDLSEEHGSSVIYGHTDSIFCSMDSPEDGVGLNKILNEKMAPIEVEFEKWCSSMIIIAKNRYAAQVPWTDGQHHEPELYVKGIELKQSRLPAVFKDVLSSLIGNILDGKEKGYIISKLEGLVQQVTEGKVPIEDLCINAELRENLEDYSVLGEARAGAAWANKVLGKGYRKGSNFLCTLDINGSYIAFDDPKDIEGFAEVGYSVVAERFILKKVKPYFELLGWSMVPLENAISGVSKIAWL